MTKVAWVRSHLPHDAGATFSFFSWRRGRRCSADTNQETRCSSNLVEAGDVDGLDELVEGLDSLLKVVGGDLEVLDDATNEDLLNAEGNRFLLVLSLPEEAVHLDL